MAAKVLRSMIMKGNIFYKEAVEHQGLVILKSIIRKLRHFILTRIHPLIATIINLVSIELTIQ
jgi:hypothetical protein